MIEVAVRSVLINNAPLAALIGTRVFPDILPQDPDYPAITYSIVSGTSGYSMTGSSEIASPRIQFDLYANSNLGLLNLKSAFMNALSGFKGTVGGVEIYGAFRELEHGGYERELERAGPRVYRRTLDFVIWFREVY